MSSAPNTKMTKNDGGSDEVDNEEEKGEDDNDNEI